MRRILVLSIVMVAVGCSSRGGGFEDGPDGQAPGDSGASDTSVGPQQDSGPIDQFGDSSTGDSAPPVADASVSTTVYANTDDTLYSLNPQSNATTLIGKFAGTSGGTNDSAVTDLAVNANGDVYVNTESVIYKAALPSSPPATVQLTKIAGIALQTGQKFYALAFAPAGALDTSEVLIGGDGYGELYSISTSSGATQDLGNFGPDPSKSGNDFALSGDLVFYMDGNNKPTGLATVRSCVAKTTSCTTTNDFLVGVDMTALAAAYKNKTPATSLLGGIYGGSSTSVGAGTGYGHLFGLGAWEGKVFAFQRASGTSGTPQLVAVSTTTGAGSVVGSTTAFTNGWSGAGVTTTVTVTVAPPPPPPH